MTVTRRDVAARCERCSRVTLGVTPFGVAVDGLVGITFELCRRCRSEVADITWHAIHETPAPAARKAPLLKRAVNGSSD